MRVILLWMVSSIALVGCAMGRPDVEVCIVNAPNSVRKCYNLRDDYDDQGRLKPGARPKYHPNVVIGDLNKALLVDSPHDAQNPNPNHFEDGAARLKAWIQRMREEYGDCR